MKTLLTTSAIVALLSAPVFAQGDNEQIDIDQPAATEMAPDGAMDAPLNEDLGVMDDQVAPEAITPDAVAPEQAVEAPIVEDDAAVTADNQMFLNRQDTDEDLASNWIGQSIYNRADENLGDVNDLLFTDTGSVGAVIVGVGGFLGIGEKNVAVPFEALESRTDENGDVTLYINATAEQLDAAPEFMTLAEIQAEERARAAQAEMEPAPAPAL
ncbi:PRC-barrel domain-containing protein [Bauldia litoralis]|uniref:PRC-barrel domain-containing protein n=1 Tax=Bauldia litoralis TaxID=665467 RepID=A0A1G6D453_9HYPH|nr:PRC-barrel domain-containing protein [Bauldia litoralis]SDB39860.1 PRC-barrel domain-containing protein [Bauldia litoralis]